MMKKGVLVISSIVVILVLLATFFIVIVVTVKYVYKGDDAVRDIIEVSVPGGIDERDLGQQIKQPSEKVLAQFKKLVTELNKPHNVPCLLDYKLKDESGMANMEGFSIQFMKGSSSWTAQLINPDQQSTHFDIITGNELCVVAGNIQGEIKGYDIVPLQWNLPKPFSGPARMGGQITFAVVTADGKVTVQTSKDIQEYYRDVLGLNLDAIPVAAQYFYLNWISEGKKNTQVIEDKKRNQIFGIHFFSPDYIPAQTLTMTDAQSMEFFTQDGKEYNTGKEDGGLLYVPKKGNVCVMGTYQSTGSNNPLQLLNPTNYGCDSGEKGLDNDCIEKIKLAIPTCR